MAGGYVELRARSAMSFGDGSATPEALVERAALLGYGALALCDAADLGGLIRAAVAGGRMGVRPIAGAEIQVDGHPVALLARTEEGFHHLAALTSEARLGRVRGAAGVSFAQVRERAAGLHVLTGGPACVLAARVREGRTREALDEIARWRELVGEHLAVEVQRHHVSGAEMALTEALIELAERAGVPSVVTNEPRHLDAAGRRVHDLLTANRCGVDYETALRTGRLLPNGEWRLKSPAEMSVLWKGYEAGLKESARIAEGCFLALRWLRPPLPCARLPEGHTEDSYLRELVLQGARERWGRIGERERGQVEHELRVIGQLGFAGFFLVMWDACRHARAQGILCQGRGSAANSTVAFCLGITAVDPVRNDLLFERFLNPERTDGLTEAPDIDVDFEAGRREEILTYVYDRYGRDHAALACVTQLYHAPTALQDMARALGYPAELVAKVSKRVHHLDPSAGARAIAEGLGREVGLEVEDARGRALLAAMRALDEVPRLRSTHPGGMVLSRRPLGEYMSWSAPPWAAPSSSSIKTLWTWSACPSSTSSVWARSPPYASPSTRSSGAPASAWSCISFPRTTLPPSG